MTILRIDASPRTEASVSRKLLDRVEAQVGRATVRRDLEESRLPHVTGTWAAATFTPPEKRSPEHAAALEQSDRLVAELMEADTILISTPLYNFTVPSSLKAWFDLVARVGVTFRYTENGPEGLLHDKRVVVAVASGGTELGSDVDFLSPYVRFFFGFLGITDVSFVSATGTISDADAALAKGEEQVADLAA